ncbi:hypothetical protein HELRODRAFT_184088 [Helobdella robusta]|uniref:Uncharacterized protein n=1 Tax=Helobdella robusta TaxID=6412 RepID=T1FKK1_HELRO|nr:hypothetical protein HELRODRAFT_184088 [Helobdella robusta]ESO08282.1 hypothetical protein HELRODRAFT_184088 [Helobdella robusta]
MAMNQAEAEHITTGLSSVQLFLAYIVTTVLLFIFALAFGTQIVPPVILMPLRLRTNIRFVRTLSLYGAICHGSEITSLLTYEVIYTYIISYTYQYQNLYGASLEKTSEEVYA